MKAKNLFKKSLAWMLTLVLIVLAVPMAAFVASAVTVHAPESINTAPTLGANATDITANLTLSDEAMNADWKDDGKFAWSVAQNQYYTFNGIDFAKGNNKIVYATATFTNRAEGGDGTGIYGTVFTTAGDYNYLRPAWNQQGHEKYNAVQVVGNVVPAGNGSLAGDVWKVTYKWDVDNGMVDIWLNTRFHAGFDWPVYDTNADFYVGKYYLNECDPQFGLRTRPQADLLTGTVNVQDVMVWEETAVATEGGSVENLADDVDVYVGGTMTAGTTSAILTTVPNFGIGATKDTDGVYDATGSGVRSRKTVYWNGLVGDLSKGSITYEADLTVTTPAGPYERHSGFTVAKVDGHFVTAGLGVHNADNKFRPFTFINGGNLNEGGATQTVLGGSASMSASGQTITASDEGTLIKIKVVLSSDSLAFYVNGKLEQFYNLTGKDVVPFFGYLWQTGKAADNISNVKIYGNGVEVCTHTFDGCTDTTCDACGYTRSEGAHEYDDANDAFCNICNAERVLLNLLFKNGQLNADYGTHVKGATVPAALTLSPSQFAVQSIVFGGTQFDLSKGSYTISADFKVTTNASMESHFGITAVVMNGDIYTFGMLSNGNWSNRTPTQEYSPYVRKNHANDLLSASGARVTATDAGATINLKVTVSEDKVVYYVNGSVAYTLDMSAADSVAPFAAFTSRGANVEVSNVKIDGAAAFNCRHAYDNDADEDCNNCGAVRVAPGKVLPTIGENTNFVGNLVFNNPEINAELAENGTITTSGLNGKANGVLLNENGAAYIKTDITFNGNVDWNWVGTTNEETGETTYSYKETWGRTGVQIGTYYSTGRERRMSVFVTYRRCTGGVYVWDEAQEVNGSGNPVVVGGIARNKEAINLIVKYDSATNSVVVWIDGAFLGTASLEAFGEFEFALGFTQNGSGTTAVDPTDNTNPEATPNSVTFSNIEIWGDLTATCVHEYDNDCDADCNKCGEEREAGHNWADADCTTPATCTVCGATNGEALGHDWADADCDTPKTCNTCGATEGEALGHNWADADCTTPATCTVCGATNGEALGHDWADADCDTPKTCNTCGATEGEALGHNWADADCTTPATCTVCGATTGEALGHDWADADCDTPKTCNTCGATEGEALGHNWADADCDTPKTCNVCGATEGEALGHDWADADCDTPKTCNTCGATEGEALGHNWADADCTTPATCTVCGATTGEALGHDWADADCDTPKTCNTCGATEGEALGHNWADADCTTPATCTVCGATTGEALGHDWADADCDTPKTCNTCGATEGEALGHNWADADCTTPATCTVCGATTGEALGHDWADADCDTPKTCNTCGATEGEALGHVYDDDYDATCNVCGYEREVPERPADIVIGSGDTQDKIEVVVGEVLPVLEKVGTKFVLGWTNSLGEVVTTYNGETDLVAEYVETLMMTVKYQVGTDGDSIRYIASVDQTERYTKVGWAFSLVNANPEVGGENVVVRDSSLVYQGLLADGQVKTAADIYGGADYAQYLYVFEITNIPEAAADSIIYVRPYVEMNDGTIVYGEVNAESLNTIKAK